MILAAIVCCAAGFVAAGFPARAASRAGTLFRAATGIAIGLGVSSAWFAARLMASGQPPGFVDEAILSAAGLLLWIVLRRKPRAEPGPIDPAPRWLWTLFVLGCALAAAAVAEHLSRFPDGGWDAWMIWTARARFLARSADFRAAFSPYLHYLTHQDYPWLLPGAVAEGLLSAGDTPMVPLVVAVLFGILTVAIVACGLSAREGMRWGLLAGLAVVAFPRFIISVADEQSDVPLALYFALASLLLSADSPRERWLAGVAAGLGMWTKNEGTLYAAALMAAFVLRQRDLRGAVVFALGALPFAALLVWFKLTLAPPNDLAAFSATGGVLRNAVDVRRWAELLYETLRRLVYFQQFGLWLVAAALAAVVLARRQPLSPVALALLLSCLAFAAIYVLQDAQQVHWLFRTSADRLVVQMWPSLLIAAIPALRRSR